MSKHTKTSGRDRLWNWFSLSYASWVTMPRAFMHEMPDEWQDKMAALLEEWDETFTNWPDEIGGTRVQITKGGKLTKTPQWLTNYRHPDRTRINAVKSDNPTGEGASG